MNWQKSIFILLCLACFLPFISPPVSLAMGLVVAFTFGNHFSKQTNKFSKLLLKISVVLLGFGMNLMSIIDAGKSGIMLTVFTIAGTLLLGYGIGRLLKINGKLSTLITSGTAICGGSAIAAVASAIDADSDEISVSLGTIFVLNSIALFIFPVIGHSLQMTDTQFGLWTAIAIHDTSSVVGAAQMFGDSALQTATTVKLARALWIAPVALGAAYLYRNHESKFKFIKIIPWFIFLFIGAAVARTYCADFIPSKVFEFLTICAKKGMTLTLFLIGSTLSVSALKDVGVRPLIQGVILWVLISIASLIAIITY